MRSSTSLLPGIRKQAPLNRLRSFLPQMAGSRRSGRLRYLLPPTSPEAGAAIAAQKYRQSLLAPPGIPVVSQVRSTRQAKVKSGTPAATSRHKLPPTGSLNMVLANLNRAQSCSNHRSAVLRKPCFSDPPPSGKPRASAPRGSSPADLSHWRRSRSSSGSTIRFRRASAIILPERRSLPIFSHCTTPGVIRRLLRGRALPGADGV